MSSSKRNDLKNIDLKNNSDESDIDNAINLKLINQSTIPFKTIINSLTRFSSNSNDKIELLHANWINEFLNFKL